MVQKKDDFDSIYISQNAVFCTLRIYIEFFPNAAFGHECNEYGIRKKKS
jgi:hypothetical protein